MASSDREAETQARRLPRPRLLRARTGRELALVASRFPVGQFWFVAIVTMVAVGIGTIII